MCKFAPSREATVSFIAPVGNLRTEGAFTDILFRGPSSGKMGMSHLSLVFRRHNLVVLRDFKEGRIGLAAFKLLILASNFVSGRKRGGRFRSFHGMLHARSELSKRTRAGRFSASSPDKSSTIRTFPISRHYWPISAHFQGAASLRASRTILLSRLESRRRQRREALFGKPVHSEYEKP